MINFWFSNKSQTGGSAYNRLAYQVLSRSRIIRKKEILTNFRARGHTYLRYLLVNGLCSSTSNDIDIMDYNIASYASSKMRGKRIVIFFHFDLKSTSQKRKLNFFFKKFLKNSRNALVVVISNYWKNYLLNFNIKNLKVIYNAFDPDVYVCKTTISEFNEKFKLANKPIIYIGKNDIAKTKNTFNLLSKLKDRYNIITTGAYKEFDGPIFLNLDFQSYVDLLYHSSLTVLLTPFSEGWSRIAHESILCGTPVIGNGAGGMSELLAMSHQRIRTAEQISIDEINKIIQTNERVDQKIIKKMKKFDLTYFENEWNNAITQVEIL